MNTELDIVDELFASDEASALTNRAAREIERLREELGNAATDRGGNTVLGLPVPG